MKKIFISIIFIFIFIVSCNKKQDKNEYSISTTPEFIIKNDVVFAAKDKDSLNNFYDLTIIDSFVITNDMYTDTVIRIYKNLDFSNCLFKGIKGNGPKEIIPIISINKAADYDTITLYELNTKRIKQTFMTVNNDFSDFKSEFLRGKISEIDEFNMTTNYIYGMDMEERNILIYNKQTQNIVKLNYYPKADKEYDEERLGSVYNCRLVANEKKQTVCAAMFSINCVNFFNLKGELNKCIIIGDRLKFPKPHPIFLDFAQEHICFSSVSGTDDYVYCLYRDIISVETIASNVFIFVFNWNGEHITTIQTDGDIWRIAADKGNNYLLGLSSRNRWNSMDVVKIPLEGILKK
jgi:hypothetical protein